MIEESMIREKFIKGYDCSQVVLSYFAERLGITEEMANKVSACFGGGMMHGDTCGAFTGANHGCWIKIWTLGCEYSASAKRRNDEQICRI